MHLTKLLSVAAIVFPIAFAASTCKVNSGQSGLCISRSSCTNQGGKSEAGHCPGGTDIQCCTFGDCKLPSGQEGRCQVTSACGGTKTPGLCKGPDDVQCCTYGGCMVNGQSGKCINTDKCTGTSTPGLCAGPADVQCCTGGGTTPPPSGGGGGGCEGGTPTVNSATVSLIREFEGFSPTPYLDPGGRPTISIGHLCSSRSCSEIRYHIPLSSSDGAKLLNDDLKTFRSCITHDIKNTVTLNPNQYGALVSWAFNVGCGNSGSSTLIRRLNSGEDPNTVAEEELPKWNRDNSAGGVLPGLVRRRAAEVKLFKTATGGTAHPNPC